MLEDAYLKRHDLRRWDRSGPFHWRFLDVKPDDRSRASVGYSACLMTIDDAYIHANSLEIIKGFKGKSQLHIESS